MTMNCGLQRGEYGFEPHPRQLLCREQVLRTQLLCNITASVPLRHVSALLNLSVKSVISKLSCIVFIIECCCTDEDVEIELVEEELPFLKGHGRIGFDLSPVRIVKVCLQVLFYCSAVLVCLVPVSWPVI